MEQIGWLSVNQLVFYHSVLLIYKTKKQGAPKCINEMFSSEYSVDTRQAKNELLRPIVQPKLDLTLKSFRYRAVNSYNKVPLEIRKSESDDAFKSKLKAWTLINIDFK